MNARSRNDAAELRRLTGAALSRQEERMRRNLAEEAQLRAALEELYRPPDWSAGAGFAAHHLGADKAWARWVGRRKEALNMELARVLAQRSYIREELQQAFGRDEAAAAMQREETRAARDLEEARREARLRDALLLRGMGRTR